ncbi:MAG TPA: GAF domain-containing protein [Saprospiraceae bacterium]|nr:GAF domain-containing protein [Saprospiraceae bacterium]
MNLKFDIRDIVNREIVNLENCEHEPIHIPGSIQQHGFLLGIKTTDEHLFIIDYCSENCIDYLPFTYDFLLGKSIADVFGPEMENVLLDYQKDSGTGGNRFVTLEYADRSFYCSLHKSAGILVLEGELVSSTSDHYEAVQQQTQQLLSYMQQSQTLQQLCQLVAADTRKITGYDRVMIYRFDDHYNGEVFAESLRNDLEPFLGLHYPHTDIPVQARQLYIKNLLRIISDVHYSPSPIYTVNDSPDKNLDLSMATLRSTSPIHIQYLINMGVSATLTISLVHKNRLWGLIACHHYSPKNISPDIRLAAQLQGHFITSQIEIRENNEQYENSAHANSALQQMLARPFALVAESFAEIVQIPELLQLCNAHGVAILFRGAVYRGGITPSVEAIVELAAWLATSSNGKPLHSASIQTLFPQFETACETTAGLLYHPLHHDRDCIIWFRQETITQVNWAGNPAKSIEKDQNGLSPRKSFALWQETVKCHSKKWLPYELETASIFSQHMQRHRSAILLSEEERKYRLLSEVLNETNQELENLNWISTHDLQEPLRKIQMFASRILTKHNLDIKDEVLQSVERINSSAEKMRALIKDILLYNKLRNSETFFEQVNLQQIVRGVLEDYSEMIVEKNAKIHLGELPELKGITFMLRQLFVNLIHNALKFSLSDTAPEIDIYAEADSRLPDQEGLFKVVVVKDNGIGFEQKYAESIFAIFKRLHAANDFPGSGIGLSLSRKVMQMHGGDIIAEGMPGEGAVFRLYFR